MPLDVAEFLYQALAAEFGVVVESSDLGVLKSRLETARKKDPDLADIAFVISPINGKDMWLIKRKIPREALNGAQG
jgi:hypothetical protein